MRKFWFGIPIDITELQLPGALATAIITRLVKTGIIQCVSSVNIGVAGDWGVRCQFTILFFTVTEVVVEN